MVEWDYDSRSYVLSSGRRIRAFSNRLSLDEDLVLAYGHDSEIWINDEDFFGPPLTKDERAEIADAMISRWQAWKVSP